MKSNFDNKICNRYGLNDEFITINNRTTYQKKIKEYCWKHHSLIVLTNQLDNHEVGGNLAFGIGYNPAIIDTDKQGNKKPKTALEPTRRYAIKAIESVTQDDFKYLQFDLSSTPSKTAKEVNEITPALTA